MKYEYGASPEIFGVKWEPEWHEYMHYLYLPVDMPTDGPGVRLPHNLEFARRLVEGVEKSERRRGNKWDYIYVTARRGYASPGNPLNRPGWHADGFGTDDINYIWSDRWPTRFAIGQFATGSSPISDDHVRSAEQFEERIKAYNNITVQGGVAGNIYRLDPSVIHATPIIPPPGGNRSFLKISCSNDRYNLLGNSHNHLFDYDWKMWDRSEIRNDPAWAGGDSGPQS